MIQKKNFHLRSIDTWNGLKEEVIMVKNEQQPRKKMDKYKSRDRIAQM